MRRVQSGRRPWSKLQKQLYLVFDPALDLQIHCSVVRAKTNLPRYWITLDGDTLWDYPGDFLLPDGATFRADGTFIRGYPFSTDISEISAFLREYLDTPPEELMSRVFASDHWGLANILRAADRRIGRRQWPRLKRKTHNQAALRVLAAREAAHEPECE